MSQLYDVIVVGCGAAGIAALSKLVESGVRVLALEANSRLGGRINTVHFGDSTVDLGAQWCHGEKDNAVFNIVKDMKVLGKPGKHAKMYVTSDGKIATKNEFDKYYEILSSIVKDCRKINGKTTESIVDYVKAEYNKRLDNVDFVVDKDTSLEMLEWFFKTIQAKLTRNALLEKSVNSFRETWDNDGEMWLNWKDKGYQLIIDILLKRYPDPSKALPVEILMNKEVINIKWGSNQSSPRSNSGSLVQLTCRDGSLFTAKHAIVTLPLGVLKERYEATFTPSLPDDKILTIRSIAMCTMNKIYMRFPRQWWPEESMEFNLLWRPDDKKHFVDEESWLTDIYSIRTVEGDPSLLCAFVTGTSAEEMELLSHQDVHEGLFKLLKYFQGKIYDVPEPTDILRSAWYTNTLARGSFSYRSVETECEESGAESLGRPLTLEGSDIPVVCFAGEATSLHFHSSAHGAVESGFREANRLIKYLKA